MVGSGLLLVIPTLLCAVTRSFGALLALRAAQGVLIPGITAVSVAYAGDRFDRRRLPAVVGGIIAASVTGGLIGRVLGGFIASAAGWREASLPRGTATRSLDRSVSERARCQWPARPWLRSRRVPWAEIALAMAATA